MRRLRAYRRAAFNNARRRYVNCNDIIVDTGFKKIHKKIKKISIDFIAPDYTEYSEDSLYAASAEYVYGQLLKNAGIEFTKITVCTDKSDDGSIIISKVTVFSGQSAAEIKRALGVVAENYEVEVVNGQID